MNKLITIVILAFILLVGGILLFRHHQQFYYLSEKIELSYKKKDYSKVKLLCDKYLNLANKRKRNWNYGNAIHDANIYLGLVALKESDIKLANMYLLKAGGTPGSPQLNSFGPSFVLARKLLENGEKEAVLKYLDSVEVFWANPEELAKWKQEINEGNLPKDYKWSLDVSPHR
ncbi:hypothetical protein ACFL6U_03770 [Planctomycetota bacterium]